MSVLMIEPLLTRVSPESSLITTVDVGPEMTPPALLLIVTPVELFICMTAAVVVPVKVMVPELLMVPPLFVARPMA